MTFHSTRLAGLLDPAVRCRFLDLSQRKHEPPRNGRGGRL